MGRPPPPLPTAPSPHPRARPRASASLASLSRASKPIRASATRDESQLRPSDSQTEKDLNKDLGMKRRRDDDPRTKQDARSAASPVESTQRRPSYLVQREERELLAEQVRALETQLEDLRIRAGLPTQRDRAEIEAIEAESFELEEKLHVNDLFLARIQSKVTRETLNPPVNPLSTFIHLPVAMDQRRRILRDLEEIKLRRAKEAATERFRYLDPMQPYLSEERFSTEDGRYHCLRATIDQFTTFPSARALFDYYVHFLYNMEISVTEMLGQLTIREDQEDVDPTIWNQRIVTTAENVGCTEELNIVVFARFYDEASGQSGAPFGVIAYDTVNIDDLYPYLPEERTCKDVQIAILVYEMPHPETGERVVVLKQCFFTVQLPPQFPMEPDKLRQLQDNCSVWPVAMLKYLREYGSAAPP